MNKVIALILLLGVVGCNSPYSVKELELQHSLTSKHQEIESSIIEQAKLLIKDLKYRRLLVEDRPEYAFIYDLALKIIPTEYKNNQIEFHLLKNPSANAFALPNGHIIVNEGLIAILENDAQLAAILAHELIHITHRHGFKSYINRRNVTVTAHLANFALFGTSLAYIPALAAVAGHSREMEFEADKLSLQIVHDADFSVAESVNAFKVLHSLPESATIKNSIYGTHPDNESRIDKIKQTLKSDYSIQSDDTTYEASKQFLLAKHTALLSSIKYRTLQHQHQLALDLVDRYHKVFEPSAQSLHLQGEAYRLMAENPKRSARKAAKLAGLSKANNSLLQEYQDTAKEYVKEAYLALNKSVAIDAQYSASYRSLGLLEKSQLQNASATKYLNAYLELNPDAHDRLYIKRTLTLLQD